MGFVIGYIRVSSVDQYTDRQLDNVKVNQTYIEKASGRDTNRPELRRMLESVRPNDTVVVHSMDRLARNTVDLLNIVQDLADKKVSIQFIKEGLTFTGDDSPMNTLLLATLGGVAQFERSTIKERQREGIAIAKAKGVYSKHGRKKAITDTAINEIKQRIAAGEPKAKIAKDMGISRDTLYRYQ